MKRNIKLNKVVLSLVLLVTVVLSSFGFSCRVFADEVTLPGDMIQICYIPGGYELYVHASDFDVSKMAWGKNNGSDYSWYYVGPNLSEVYYRNGPDKSWQVHYNMSNLSMTPYTTVPITCASLYVFNSLSEAQAYVNGEIDASCAVNYDEILNSLMTFDSSIPVPSKAFFNVITDSTVSSTFSYDENELTNFKNEYGYELQYEYEVEYLYQLLTKAQIKNQNSSISVENINSDSEQFALDSNGLFVAKSTCGELFDAFSASGLASVSNCLATADSGKYLTSGVVSLDNAIVSSPPNYYEKYSIPFSVFSMEYHMQFIIAQARITSFYIDDSGIKHCSDSIYIRRALWDKDNEHYGSTYTRITKDENGNDTFQSSYKMDSNGNDISTTLGSFDSDSLLGYIESGYGLAGKDGYLELLKRTFVGVPVYIWGIIATALTVNIIVILFKVIRGM